MDYELWGVSAHKKLIYTAVLYMYMYILSYKNQCHSIPSKIKYMIIKKLCWDKNALIQSYLYDFIKIQLPWIIIGDEKKYCDRSMLGLTKRNFQKYESSKGKIGIFHKHMRDIIRFLLDIILSLISSASKYENVL